MKRVLITGSNGQLGSELKYLSSNFENIEFVFANAKRLDVTSKEGLTLFFEANQFDYCINCAAYTAVDKAEEEKEHAELINATAAKYLAEITKINRVKYIHISTDFVFSGDRNTPYTEIDNPRPINYYGASKLRGEQLAISANKDSVVIRTSWLYSSFGNNFVKTMLRLAESKNELGIVCDQIGTPTYARDLANAILKIIMTDNYQSGVYHYSNEGVASWYDFAQAIFEEKELIIKLKPIRTEQYPTPAQRPPYSVMSKAKINNTFKIKIPHWRESLRIYLAYI